MTEKEQKMIAAYLPHDPDHDLMPGEYYVKDIYGRVRKCRITDIFPRGEKTEYGLVEASTGRYIDSGMGSFRGFEKCELYDNRIDCKNNTHIAFEMWEMLREVQKNGKQ